MHYYTLDVFTRDRFLGNPLAVFPEPPHLSDAYMQTLTREFCLEETVFVYPPQTGGHVKLRIFAMRQEMPFAGHPTIGTALLLAHLGKFDLQEGINTVILEENVGHVPVDITVQDGKAVYAELTAAQAPQFLPEYADTAKLAKLLTLPESEILPHAGAVSCGVPYLLIPVRSLVALQNLSINTPIWNEVVHVSGAEDIYVFCQEPELQARMLMFSEDRGVREDAATGSAATPLAAWLALHSLGQGESQWHLIQGQKMGRESHLTIKAYKQGSEVLWTKVGGHAVLVGKGEILP